MRRRRGGGGIAANPVLIGAATTLVVIVAVFLAYNANNGLPFVPTYDLKVEVPSAANLVKGNEVRIAGTRVGVIDAIGTKQLDNGRVIAVLSTKLQTSVQDLPVDSSVLVRPRTALGLKYLQITEGTSMEGFQNGATVPLANARPVPVELDELFNAFDPETRSAQQLNLFEFGNALAGRGADINTAIGALNPFFTQLIPVARNLSSTQTQLANLFPALNRVATIVAPAAETQASLFTNLDTTFSALASVAPFISRSIALGPSSLDQAISSFRLQRPFLANTAALFRELRPGVAALKDAAPDLTSALVVGTPALRRLPAFNAQLTTTLKTLESFATDPLVRIGISDLTSTVSLLGPTLAFLKPAQTTCNYVTLFFRNAANLLSEGTSAGTWQRFIVIPTPTGPNSETGPASAPANGGGTNNFLHWNGYPNTAAPGQPNECEAGNEPFLEGQQQIGNPPGTQPATTEQTGIDRSTG